MLVPYEGIRIINLRSRADRRREVAGDLKRLGVEDDHQVEFIEAVVPAELWVS